MTRRPQDLSVIRPVEPVAARRGRRTLQEGPALTEERLVEVLFRIAATDGIAGLNMRHVASELRVSTRLLYHYVRDKEEMVGLLCDVVTARSVPSNLEGSWRERLATIARTTRASHREIQGAPHWVLTRTTVGLNAPTARHLREEVRRALLDAGLTNEQAGEAFIVFAVLTMGQLIVTESAGPALTLERGNPGFGITPEGLEASFEMGLRFFISGVESMAAERAATQSPPGPDRV